MRWPWAADPPPSPGEAKRRPVSWTDTLNATDWAHYAEPRTVIPSVLLTLTTLALLRVYKAHLRRIPSVDHIKPDKFRTSSLFGKVTSVGDADNFRLFHTPGGRLAGWGWAPGRRVEVKKGIGMKTIHVRIAGIDAPELAHFGRPEQPYAKEAHAWLTAYILGRRVRAYIHRRDQYDRVVATVFVRRWLLRRDVGLEMLKRGLATVYEAKSGSEFGSFERKYRDAEERAKRGKVGMWAEPGLLARLMGEKPRETESPREYKRRMGELEAGKVKGKGKKQGESR